ncbi:hypothetical protein [Listeria costaricensis]|uniref:hypothetical protein n=1 Tax=Listeria costaricensis TaxID=2026604 RepID=UPI000C0771D0|nr:hypothetical protein [Listeria costaricensis]
MRYVRSFLFSEKLMQNPNIYPYNQLRSKTGEVLIFDDITILYGENGAGKSTILNLLASKLAIPGAEYSQTVSQYDYFAKYLAELLNECMRFHGSQFVIATHSPFLLGNLAGTIYQLDLPGVKAKEWQELPNMKVYQQFFENRKADFD